MKALTAAACLLLIPAAAALANDTTAELATGGLQFVTSSDIEMQAEDLFVSPDTVKVRYQFQNTSKKPVTTLVAFPMPDITVAGLDDNIAVPTENPENILGFKTLVDGKPVATKVQQRVFAYGIDRTEDLRKLGVPLAPHLAATQDALTKLPKDKWSELSQLGLALPNAYDVGKGMERHLSPTWTLKTTYYWLQDFPVGKTLKVEHTYQPSVGSSAGVRLDYPDLPDYKGVLSKYCIEPSFIATYRRLKQAAGKSGIFNEQRISYVLTTGANWSGPIKSFRLVVDKGSPDNLVSFCADGVKKIGPTQFEVKKADYAPDRELDILIIFKRHD